MKHLKRYIVTTLNSILVICSASTIASDKRTDVSVGTECQSNQIGKRVGFELREALRASKSLSFSSTERGTIHVHLRCIEQSFEEDAVGTYYSVTITLNNTMGYYDFLLASGVAGCGADQEPGCARDLLGAADDAVIDLRNKVHEGLFSF